MTGSLPLALVVMLTALPAAAGSPVASATAKGARLPMVEGSVGILGTERQVQGILVLRPTDVRWERPAALGSGVSPETPGPVSQRPRPETPAP